MYAQLRSLYFFYRCMCVKAHGIAQKVIIYVSLSYDFFFSFLFCVFFPPSTALYLDLLHPHFFFFKPLSFFPSSLYGVGEKKKNGIFYAKKTATK